ncbi:MAG: hypothetical protein A2X08_10030 [Bacteroidetes bacterium GWA2_32_17]|nr:MAG: hypothetical protein A2X08_10030 [Bacteroidetes bacterium GWA2_32_17]
MCFHNSLSVTAQDLEHRYKAKFDNNKNFKPIFHGNAFNFIKLPVITNKNVNEIVEFNWGLIPHWVKNADDAKKIKTNTLNAKSETVFEKPSFRNSIKNKRCIIPSTGFFEWQYISKNKIPYFIFIKEIKVFSFAGIWEEWTNTSTGEIHKTFSILTTKANPLMEKIHNIKKRMPVILNSEDEIKWLTNDINEKNILAFCKPYPENKMQAYTVSKLISSKTEDSNKIEVLNKFNYQNNNVQLLF